MNARQQRFVVEFLVDLNATQAALRAGYNARTAYAQGFALLKHPEVQKAISEGKAKQLRSAELSATRILEELRRLSTVDIRDYFDGDGNLKPVKDLTPEQGAALSSVEVLTRNTTAGDGKQETVHKIKLWDKTRALEMLAKHFALLTDVIRLQDESTQIDKLYAGRQRAADAKRGE